MSGHLIDSKSDSYKWLTDFLEVRERTSPLTLRYIIPDVFERYFLLHHNWGIIDTFPFDEYPKDRSSIDNLNKGHATEQQFDLFLRNNSEKLYTPISLKDLAERFNTDYNVNMMQHIDESPGISPLLERTINNITKVISPNQRQAPLFFYIEDPYTFTYFGPQQKVEDTKNENNVEDVKDYTDFQKRSGFDSCTHLFGIGHPWCLTTFEDFPHFILGCDNEAAERLTKIDSLEYFETSINYELLYGVFKNL